VLDLLARGQTNAQIAEQLGIGFESVKTHVSEILLRLGVDSREEAAAEWRSYHSLGGRFRRALNGLSWLWTAKAAAAGAAAFVALAALVAIAVVWRSGDDDPVAAQPAATATPSVTPAPGLTAWTNVADIEVGLTPSGITEGFGHIWVANASANSVSRIDPSINTVVATITVGELPGHIRPGLGSIWVGNARAGTVSRIDPATNSVTGTIVVHDGLTSSGGCWLGVLPTDDALWVTDPKWHEVHRYDPATLELVAKYPIPQAQGQCPLGGINAAGGFLWVGVYEFGTVQLDPDNGTLVREWPRYAQAFEVGGKVWLDDTAEQALVAVDAATGALGPTIPLQAVASRVAADDGNLVWAAENKGDSVTVYDLASGESHTIRTGRGSEAVVFAGDSAWVTNRDDNTVSRISKSP
jgi:YVTN family beta-propeller protein